MKKNYYNWYSLKSDGKDAEGILILTYALYKKYNNLLANSSHELLKTLFINRIPEIIIRRGLIKELSRGKLKATYKCEEPQSYFRNPSFLTAICPPRKKVEYLFLLSMRPVHDLSARIPIRYLNEEQKEWSAKNPFIKTIEDKIVFVPELIRNKGEK